MLNPVQLKTLQAVIATGSFADAGRTLGYTGSAVSQQISALERRLKTDLFERDAHSIRPTPAATFIAQQANAALNSLQALEDDISNFLEGAIGTLRLGSFPSASEHLLPSALSSFVRRNPRVNVRLDEGEPQDLVPLLEARDLDLALVYRYDYVPQAWPAGLTACTILVEDLLLLLPPRHRLAGRDEVDPTELAHETWITTCEETSMATNLRRLCAAVEFEPKVAYRSNDYDVIRGLVRSNLGIAIIPALGCGKDPGVHVARLAGVSAYRKVMVLRSPVATSTAVEEVTTALKSAARELSEALPGLTFSCVPAPGPAQP